MGSAYNPEPNDSGESKNHLACEANGCPLPGSMNLGGSAWCCRYHAKAPPHHWPLITRILHEHERGRKIIRAAEALKLDDYNALQEADSWKLADSIKPQPGEVLSHWINRLKDFMHDALAEKLNAEIKKFEKSNPHREAGRSAQWAIEQLTSGVLLNKKRDRAA